MFSNIITVNLFKGFGGDGLGDIVRELFQYWKPGMEPVVRRAGSRRGCGTRRGDGRAGGDGGGAGESAYTRLVPANLVERSRAALEKWKRRPTD